uniref:hypothetical protein n=1 Tax=Escherichia ruysiae TaxID=2608867 RepID=UPI00215B1B76
SGKQFPAFAHLKTMIQDWNTDLVPDEWTRVIPYFLNDDLELKISNYRQVFPVHYHIKSFISDEMIAKYEKRK